MLSQHLCHRPSSRRPLRGRAVVCLAVNWREESTPAFLSPGRIRAGQRPRRLSNEAKDTLEPAARPQGGARVPDRRAWRPSEFPYPQSRCMSTCFEVVAVEELSVIWLVHHQCVARSRHGAAWRQCADLLAHAAAWAGRRGWL